jgi:hypothetical protein
MSEAQDLGNSTPSSINVFHVSVDNMHFASNPAFSESTDLGHDDSKIPCIPDMNTTSLTHTR